MDREVVYNDSIDEHLRRLGRVLHRIDATASVDVILASPHLAYTRRLAAELLAELARFGHDRATQ